MKRHRSDSMNDEIKMDQPVYYYYNAHYSETGLISDNIKKVFQIMAKDFAGAPSHYKRVEKALDETGSFECFKVIVRKTTIKGSLNDYLDTLYVLRYPFGIYTSKKEAYYEGLKWVKDSTKTSKLSALESFRNDEEALEELWDNCSYPNHIEEVEDEECECWKLCVTFLRKK